MFYINASYHFRVNCPIYLFLEVIRHRFNVHARKVRISNFMNKSLMTNVFSNALCVLIWEVLFHEANSCSLYIDTETKGST